MLNRSYFLAFGIFQLAFCKKTFRTELTTNQEAAPHSGRTRFTATLGTKKRNASFFIIDKEF